MEVSTLVTPSLHPQTVASLEDYDDDTKGELAQVVTAFDTAYKGVAQVFEAREKAKQNPAWTEAAQVIMTQEFADKVFAKVAGGFDKVSRNLTSGIAVLEKELSGPMDTAAAGRFCLPERHRPRHASQPVAHVARQAEPREGEALARDASCTGPCGSAWRAGVQGAGTGRWRTSPQGEGAARSKDRRRKGVRLAGNLIHGSAKPSPST
jgi:hypothetical protein